MLSCCRTTGPSHGRARRSSSRRIASAAPGTARAMSTSSMRTCHSPPWWRAERWLARAATTDPKCRGPVRGRGESPAHCPELADPVLLGGGFHARSAGDGRVPKARFRRPPKPPSQRKIGSAEDIVLPLRTPRIAASGLPPPRPAACPPLPFCGTGWCSRVRPGCGLSLNFRAPWPGPGRDLPR